MHDPNLADQRRGASLISLIFNYFWEVSEEAKQARVEVGRAQTNIAQKTKTKKNLPRPQTRSFVFPTLPPFVHACFLPSLLPSILPSLLPSLSLFLGVHYQIIALQVMQMREARAQVPGRE